MKKFLVFLSLAFSVMGLTGSLAHADTVGKVITVSPATAKPVIYPGQTVHNKFQVINQGSTAYDVTIYAAPYGVHGEDYRPDFTPIPNKLNVASWMQFDKKQANITPKNTLDVGYSITVPKDTAPGGYYAVAFVQSEAKSSKGLVVNERVGEVFYIQVAGAVTQSGKIASWKVPFMQANPVTADLRLENDGGLHYSSNTHIYAQDLFGRTKYTLATDKEILPQTIRHIPFQWKSAPPLGLFKITGNVHLPSGEAQLPGKIVLVMSPVTRIIFIVIIALLIVAVLLKIMVSTGYKRRASAGGSAAAKHKPHSKKET